MALYWDDISVGTVGKSAEFGFIWDTKTRTIEIRNEKSEGLYFPEGQVITTFAKPTHGYLTHLVADHWVMYFSHLPDPGHLPNVMLIVEFKDDTKIVLVHRAAFPNPPVRSLIRDENGAVCLNEGCSGRVFYPFRKEHKEMAHKINRNVKI